MSEPITVGSTPTFQATFSRDGSAWDLTGVTVTFYLRRPSGSLSTFAATITDAVGGTAAVTLAPTDLDTDGMWTSSWKVQGGGQVFPTAPRTFRVEAAP